LPQRSLASPGAQNSPARVDALFDRFIDTTAPTSPKRAGYFRAITAIGILKGGR
jgi:hypothetical protein